MTIEHPSTHMGTKSDWNGLLQEMLYNPPATKESDWLPGGGFASYGISWVDLGVYTPKVWVVFDPLYERVLSVHSTESGADAKCLTENENAGESRRYYEVEVQEFNLEG